MVPVLSPDIGISTPRVALTEQQCIGPPLCPFPAGSNSDVSAGISTNCFEGPYVTPLVKGISMRTRTLLMVLVFFLCGVVASFAADDSNVGTWKLNEAKSEIPAGAPKNETVVYTAEGDSYKCVVDGVDGAGKPAHNEWTGKFDGKDYSVTGDGNADSRSIQKVDDRHYKLANKKDGKTVTTGTIMFSADGKTRTVSTHGTGANGRKVSTTFVYDKQ